MLLFEVTIDISDSNCGIMAESIAEVANHD